MTVTFEYDMLQVTAVKSLRSCMAGEHQIAQELGQTLLQRMDSQHLRQRDLRTLGQQLRDIFLELFPVDDDLVEDCRKLTIVADDVEKVEVFDNSGRLVAMFANTNQLAITHLPTGTYALRISLQKGNTVRRIIKR